MRTRRLARIRPRLLAFNVLLVFLPVLGVLFLDTYERQLLADQERSMVQQGRVLAAALSARGELRAEDVRETLLQLNQRSGARLRVVDREGRVLADSVRLAPRREAADGESPREEAALRSGWLYRLGALPFRAYRWLLRPPARVAETADGYAAGERLEGREIRAALAGRYGAATRVSAGGQRSVTLFSAIPVRDEAGVAGAVVVSQSTYRILGALYAVRLDVLRVLIASLAAAVVLSLVVSHTIATPLARLRDQASALLDRRGRLTGHLESHQRHDEIGDLSRALEELTQRLESHIHDVEEFAADVSHELKNPLASIRSAAEMWAEAESPEETRRFREIVQREVARMEHMLSGVREIGRIDAGLDGGEREPVELGALLAGIVEAHRLRGAGEVRVAPGAPALAVWSSPERLTQVFENLIDNALDFSPEGAAVDVSLAREGDRACVRVRDRGPGVPSEQRERIFHRFYTDRPGEADARSRHTGLGLAIVKSIVESEGGSVAAASPSDGGGGACLEVRLPLHPA